MISGRSYSNSLFIQHSVISLWLGIYSHFISTACLCSPQLWQTASRDEVFDGTGAYYSLLPFLFSSSLLCSTLLSSSFVAISTLIYRQGYPVAVINTNHTTPLFYNCPPSFRCKLVPRSLSRTCKPGECHVTLTTAKHVIVILGAPFFLTYYYHNGRLEHNASSLSEFWWNVTGHKNGDFFGQI